MKSRKFAGVAVSPAAFELEYTKNLSEGENLNPLMNMHAKLY